MVQLLETPPKQEALPAPSTESLTQAIEAAKYKSLTPEAVEILEKFKERPGLVQLVLENSQKPGHRDLN